MTESINILLDKYFQAKTTLEEENELKRHFSSEEISGENEIYRQLFQAFNEEAAVKMKQKKTRFVSNSKEKNKRIMNFIFYPAVAVAVLLFAFVFYNKYDNSYLIINGKKIRDAEYVELYASTKLKKVNVLLSGSLNPLDNLGKVKEVTEWEDEILESVEDTIYDIH